MQCAPWRGPWLAHAQPWTATHRDIVSNRRPR
jgi:hypothetical protein